MRLFTWRDVENLLLSTEGREKWNTTWRKVLVYPDEVVIYKDQLREDFQDSDSLSNILEKHYHSKENYIELDVFGEKLSITYEEMDEWEEDANRKKIGRAHV